MSSSPTQLAALALAALLASCSGLRVEAHLVPASTARLRTSAGEAQIALQAGASEFRLSDPSSNHELRITAPERATLVGAYSSISGGGRYRLHTRVNVLCVGGDCGGYQDRHPLAWLRGDAEAFAIPARGQGVVVTTDRRDGGVAVVTEVDAVSNLASGATQRIALRPAADGSQRTLPEVIPLAVGRRYQIVLGAEGCEAGSMELTVEASTYVLLHAAFAPARESRGSLVR